jgi:hypothetical protein
MKHMRPRDVTIHDIYIHLGFKLCESEACGDFLVEMVPQFILTLKTHLSIKEFRYREHHQIRSISGRKFPTPISNHSIALHLSRNDYLPSLHRACRSILHHEFTKTIIYLIALPIISQTANHFLFTQGGLSLTVMAEKLIA